MSFLFAQSHPIPFHAIAAMIAIILGGIQLSMQKGGTTHRFLGHIWVNRTGVAWDNLPGKPNSIISSISDAQLNM